MAISSFTKEIIIDDPERFLDAILRSAKKQGLDLDAEITVAKKTTVEHGITGG